MPVAVKIPGSELTFAQRRGAARTELDVIGEIKDDFGLTVQNMRDRLDIRLDAATAEELAARPLQYETGFSLLPGRYVLKLLVRDLVTGRIGTYQTPFAIPNLTTEETRWRSAPRDAYRARAGPTAQGGRPRRSGRLHRPLSDAHRQRDVRPGGSHLGR